MSDDRQYFSVFRTGFLIRNKGCVLAPKSSVCVNQTHLIVLDPSNEVLTNVTPNCFQITEILKLLGSFEKESVFLEEMFFEEARIGGLLGKFRDLDLKYSEKIEKEFGKKSSWIVSQFKFSGERKCSLN